MGNDWIEEGGGGGRGGGGEGEGGQGVRICHFTPQKCQNPIPGAWVDDQLLSKFPPLDYNYNLLLKSHKLLSKTHPLGKHQMPGQGS